MPVFPAVPSTMMPPGFSVPRLSASSMMNSAARSLTDWPGFMNSALPRMVHPVSSDACLSLISGVLPIASMISLRICMARAGHEKGTTVDDEAPSHKPDKDGRNAGETHPRLLRRGRVLEESAGLGQADGARIDRAGSCIATQNTCIEQSQSKDAFWRIEMA